jgi:hypothetical protein
VPQIAPRRCEVILSSGRNRAIARHARERAFCAVGRQNVDRARELALFSAVNHHQLWPSACATSSRAGSSVSGISPTDSFGQGHRADGASPRGPLAQAAAPWPRSLPTRRPSDPCCAQPSTSKVALALFSRHARDSAPLASGALASQVEALASPARPRASPAQR